MGLLLLYRAVRGPGWLLSAGAIAYGITLGVTGQLLSRRTLPKLRVFCASLLGALALWLPVVLVTYGFALAAAPIFVAYAGAVLLDVLAVSRLRRAINTTGGAA